MSSYEQTNRVYNNYLVYQTLRFHDRLRYQDIEIKSISGPYRTVGLDHWAPRQPRARLVAEACRDRKLTALFGGAVPAAGHFSMLVTRDLHDLDGS